MRILLHISHTIYIFAKRYLLLSTNIMKNISFPKTELDFNKKRTLKCYYESLPRRKTPRKEFIMEAAARCGVSEQTVRNWCLYGIKPQHFMHVKVLSEMTGIKEEDLWKD